MSNIDPKALDEQTHAIMEAMASPYLPRHAKGYQGRIKPNRVILAVVFTGEDGKEYVEDPTEFAEHGDLFLREYITIGRKSGSGLGDVLNRLLPLVSLAGGPASGVGFGFGFLQKLFGRKSPPAFGEE